ncbi:MAG: HEAT repeat domain-containing protein [Planctomycetes bacterium]|nr:HEAT repeat domain-containing protein [Planctomycetota bacterium]
MIRAVSLLFAILFAVLSAASGAAQTPEERADAVQEFRRFFRKFKEVDQQVEAVRTLEGMESVEAAKELVGLLDHKTPEVARAALDVLCTYRDPETFAGPVAALVEMKDALAQARMIQVLGRAGIREAIAPMLEIAGGKKVGEEVKIAIARALSALGAVEEAPGVVGPMLADRSGLVRMAAAQAIGELRLKALGPQLVPLLDDSAWQVQSAAITAVSRVREASAVAPLISLMEKGGRLEEECAEALFQITAMDFGTDAAAWRKTWDQLQSIEGWRIPTDEELAKRAASREKYDAIYGNRKEGTPTFGGIPTTSRRILFIVDVSGSMADLVVERERFDSGYESYEKLEIVKTELERTIDSLPDGTLFNIVAFASDLDTWKSNPTRANVVNRASAREWVRKLKPIGGPDMAGASADALAQGKTNTFKALMYPFGIDPDARRPSTGTAPLENPFDTVYFLSDGRPSIGVHTDVQVILEEVTRTNESYRMVFHTIAIGQFQKDFLRALAELNGGVFVDLGS